MVVLSCQLSLTVRRHQPESDSKPYLDKLDQFMQRTCQNAACSVQTRSLPSFTELPSYEDKGVYCNYDVLSRHRSYSDARRQLLLAYRKEYGRSREPEFYYLLIQPEPDAPNLLTYMFDFPLKTYALGFMSSPTVFHSQYHYEMELKVHTGQDPRLTLEIDLEKVMIDFAVSKNLRFTRVNPGDIAPTTEVYRLTIDFNHMSPVLLVHTTDTSVDLCFLTSTPMQLWRTQYCLTDVSRRDFDKTNWIRTCSVKSAALYGNQRAVNKVTLGGCNALMLRFPPGEDVEAILQSLAYNAEFQVYHTVLEYRPKETIEAPPPFVIDPSGCSDDKIDWMLAAIHSIGYRVRYQLQDRVIGQRFMDLVNQYFQGGSDERKHLHNALCKTYDVVLYDTERFLHLDRVLDHFLQQPRELDELVMVQTRLVKRLIVTPSRTLFQPPTLMHDNRILREFDADSAVSCSFQNDDMTGFAAVANSFEFVDETIGDTLRQGFDVARRHYEFLGCSGSQLRQNGCWFYARDSEGRTAEDIRKWMGDLEHIRNPGTYLSRMGQCFSDTTASELNWDIDIEWHDPDVEGGSDPDGKPYCFSDGVGRISQECIKLVFSNLADRIIPSAFQVRLGGSKGMLTLDRNLPGKRIMVRQSMFKFQSTHTTVEVMRRTQPTPLYLNCQVITILSQLREGIPDHVFIRFLNNMLHRFADVLMDDSKALVALSASGFSCCYAKLREAGMKFTTDPFFKGVLKAITCARISNVKQKARIEIPTEYGRAMLGIMDEEGVLEYGEVFIRYSADIREQNENLIILEGDVVVSKMPCLHPGDVRKLKAVDRPELHHLVDCIVFPQKGPRPHPNEMAGSDLDGDEYFVTWHPNLIFRGQNEAPMDFPSIRKNQQDHPITLNDMVEFIVGYIMNDKVGVISNAHLAWADQSPDGVHSTICKQLARIFCHVIDFSKTGYLPDEVKGKNLHSFLPEKYPDFMQKHDHKETYRSERVLGKIFRISQLIEQAVTTIDKEDTDRIQQGSNWMMDDRFLVDGYSEFTETAEKLYKIYAELLDAEQRRYGIESEEELVSGCVIKIKGMYSRSDEVFDVEKRLRERMKDIRLFTKTKFDEFLELARIEGVSKHMQEMMLAAACYVITYKNKRKHRSFPWLFADQLVQILKQSNEPGCEPPLVRLSKSIEAIDMKDVHRSFRLNRIQQPVEDGLARVYHALINWGQKTKFLAGDYGRRYDTLALVDFVALLDKIVEEDPEVLSALDEDTGPLLIAIFKGITNFDGDKVGGRSLPKKAMVNMKRQILLAHHQLARDPRAECLLVRKQARIKRKLTIRKDRWNTIKNHTERLRQMLKEKFNVQADFRRTRRGGLMWINGQEADVLDCSDFWINEFQANDIRPYSVLEDLQYLLGLI